MLRRDRGLDRERPVEARRGCHPDALLDLGGVPARAVLIGEQHELAVRVEPRVAARVVQDHQRQQATHLGLVGHQLGEQAGQPDRLVAQLTAYDRVVGGGQVALVEDQVEDREQRAQAIG